MSKKVIVAEILKIADELDINKRYKEADTLTGVAKRLAQFNGEYEGHPSAFDNSKYKKSVIPGEIDGHENKETWCTECGKPCRAVAAVDDDGSYIGALSRCCQAEVSEEPIGGDPIDFPEIEHVGGRNPEDFNASFYDDDY
jgi:hypothetical protein